MSGKHHATGAQGGVVFTHDEDLYWEAKRFADRGKPFNTESATNVRMGLNLNGNDLAAAIGRLERLDPMGFEMIGWYAVIPPQILKVTMTGTVEWNQVGSDFPYHYYGSVRTFSQIAPEPPPFPHRPGCPGNWG